MNFKTTMILLVVLLLLGGVIVYDRLSAPVGDGAARVEERKQESTALLTMGEGDVTSIEIDGGGGGGGDGRVAVARDAGGKWVITEPFTASADAGAVAAYIGRLSAARSLGAASEQARTGFNPVLAVKFATRAVAQNRLSLSAVNAVGEAVAKLERGGNVSWHVVGADVLPGLQKSADTFRDLRLVSVGQGEIESVSLEHGGKVVTVTKDGEQWWLTEAAVGGEAGAAIKADDASVTDLLFALTGLRAAEYPTPAPGLSQSQLVVRYRVKRAGGVGTGPATLPVMYSERTVRFGRFEDARRERVLAAADDSPVGLVAAFTLNQLRKTGLDLRDRRVLEIAPESVTKVEITEVATGKVTVLSRAAAPSTQATTQATTDPVTRPVVRWTVGDGAAEKGAEKGAEEGAVEALLEAMGPLRVMRYQPMPTSRPVASHVLRVTHGGEVTEISVAEGVSWTGELHFSPEVDLGTLLKAEFVKAPPPIPFVEPSTRP
jgi:hypothetical protein